MGDYGMRAFLAPLISVVLLCTTCFASIPEDKVMHGLAGITISGFGAVMDMTPEETLFVALYIGVAKECYDNQTGGSVELADVVATVAGAFIGILLIQMFGD